jgi:Zn-dependent peptidase ImmA (M78 family)
MPKAMLEAEVKLPVSDDQVTELAKRFGVSEQAMTIRLSRLGFL